MSPQPEGNLVCEQCARFPQGMTVLQGRSASLLVIARRVSRALDHAAPLVDGKIEEQWTDGDWEFSTVKNFGGYHLDLRIQTSTDHQASLLAAAFSVKVTNNPLVVKLRLS